MFQQPFESKLAKAQNILITGCGGGYDLVGGIPFWVELLRNSSKKIHFAGVTFTNRSHLRNSDASGLPSDLFPIVGDDARPDVYCPEAWMARWLDESQAELPRPSSPHKVWLIKKTGVEPTKQCYEYLAAELKIDAVILVDGGVDSLLRGDESSIGTPAEDFTSLAALSRTDIPLKVLACVGMGAEVRDGICHAQVFDRIQELQAKGGHWGSFALLAESDAGAAYLDLVNYLFENQSDVKRSHVHRSIKAAMTGDPMDADTWLSPLLNQFMTFDLEMVASANLMLPDIANTQSIGETTLLIEGIRKSLDIADRRSIPL